jgi:fumarate hydratase class II
MTNVREETGSFGVAEVRADKFWSDQTQCSPEVQHCHSERD